MRLINIHTLKLHTFNETPPAYAILSHRWGDDEISYQDFENPAKRHGSGYRKVVEFCQLVRRHIQPPDARGWDGKTLIKVDYAWVDTCCIDKTSSAELSESINSMWKWYKQSTYCIAYLEDVKTPCGRKDVVRSGWFRRGWTLQELLAPHFVLVCDQSWHGIGSKNEASPVREAIIKATGIASQVLHSEDAFDRASVAERMSWAAGRETTRPEDRAYSLMGLFDVNMPLLYGEGQQKAFFRLQEEIIRHSDDNSIFAFDHQYAQGILADSPDAFQPSGNVRTLDRVSRPPYSITQKGLQLDSPAIHIKDGPWARCYIVKLNCVRMLTVPDHERSDPHILDHRDQEFHPGGMAQGCILCLEDMDGVFVRRPRLELTLPHTTASEAQAYLRSGHWEKLQQKRFFVVLSSAAARRFPSDGDSVAGVHVASEPPLPKCQDVEGQYFLGRIDKTGRPRSYDPPRNRGWD